MTPASVCGSRGMVVERHRPSLRKAGKHDAIRRDAACSLPRNQLPDLRIRLAKAGQVFQCLSVEPSDVVPGAHAHAAD